MNSLFQKRSTTMPAFARNSSRAPSSFVVPACWPPSSSMTSFFAGQKKSTTYGPITCCLLNLRPAIPLLRKHAHSLISAAVIRFPRPLALLFIPADILYLVFFPSLGLGIPLLRSISPDGKGAMRGAPPTKRRCLRQPLQPCALSLEGRGRGSGGSPRTAGTAGEGGPTIQWSRQRPTLATPPLQ